MRLIQRAGVAGTGRRVRRRREDLGHAAPLELGEQLTQAIGQDGDLDLLEQDAHDALAVAGLEEEGAVAGFADRAGHESVGWIEEIASSGHDLTLSDSVRADASRPGRARSGAPDVRACPSRGRRPGAGGVALVGLRLARRRRWPGP